MRVLKWTTNFDPKIESSIAPVWIRLLELPVHLFEKNALFTLASKIGKPSKMDEATADLSRLDVAPVCVQLDLTSSKVQAVYLNIEGKTYRQQILVPATVTIEKIDQNGDRLQTENTGKVSAEDININATDVEFPISHVHAPKSLATLENNLPGNTMVTSPNDYNYEHPLIVELLDKDWDADKTSQNKESSYKHC
ncbi:UNVERIFIED_CONTAM: hypothetical protein Sindi_0495000 [Sesamum indicum]